MKNIHPTEILDYYDGIEIFAGLDEIGGSYLGVRCEVSGEHDRYVVVGVRPERLREFRSGVLDLRDLMLDTPGGDWYITLANMAYGDTMQLEPQSMPLEQSGLLPLAGFTLNDLQLDDRVLREAHERNNIILEVSVEPPEAVVEHRVRSNTLGSLLIQMQVLVKHAYRAALRDLSDNVRSSLSTVDGELMDVVVPAAPGSFRILLESAAKQRDMFGDGELSRALRRVDEIFEVADNPQDAT